MRLLRNCSLALLLMAAAAPEAFSASYQKTDGTIVDPIIYECCNSSRIPPFTHPYSGVDLAPGVDLQGADLEEADLREADLSDTDLRGANLGGTDLREASLSGADLRGGILGVADFRNANLTNADLRDASLNSTFFNNADLSGANLSGSRSFAVDLIGADLTGATWTSSDIDSVALIGANLSFADLRNSSTFETDASNASFADATLDGSGLSIFAPNANFTNSSLRGVRFFTSLGSRTDLSGADFAGANLTAASFRSSDPIGIPGIEPSQISVLGTDFSQAVLENVVGLGITSGAALYDSETDFTNAWADLDATIPFDPVAAGWTLVPEPSTSTLLLLGLVGLSRVRASGSQPS